MTTKASFHFFVLATSALWLAACAVGPDFKAPPAPEEVGYNGNPIELSTDSSPVYLGEAQKFSIGIDIPTNWWHLFQSKKLNALMDDALQTNQTVEAARAALLSAQETVMAAQGGFFPILTGGSDITRSRTVVSTKPSTLYSNALGLNYNPDVFGATRRAVESAEALADVAHYELEATRLSLITHVAMAAFQEASLREQVATTEGIITVERKKLELLQKRFELGAVPQIDVVNQYAVLAAQQSALPVLHKALAQTRNMLATLVGHPLGQEGETIFTLADFKLPTDLPLSLPSHLVQQRPDIRASLAALKAANAKIGIATAAMLPTISLTGSYGVGAAQASDLFSPTMALWGLAAGLTQPLFEGGRLIHEKRAAEAAFDQAAATYRQTVLAAFEDVANALSALQENARILKQQMLAERAAITALRLAQQQYDAGATSQIESLSAYSAYHNSHLGLIQAQSQRLIDTAMLYTALGGDWWTNEKKAELKK